jgi:hypothetical protein
MTLVCGVHVTGDAKLSPDDGKNVALQAGAKSARSITVERKAGTVIEWSIT